MWNVSMSPLPVEQFNIPTAQALRENLTVGPSEGMQMDLINNPNPPCEQ